MRKLEEKGKAMLTQQHPQHYEHQQAQEPEDCRCICGSGGVKAVGLKTHNLGLHGNKGI